MNEHLSVVERMNVSMNKYQALHGDFPFRQTVQFHFFCLFVCFFFNVPEVNCRCCSTNSITLSIPRNKYEERNMKRAKKINRKSINETRDPLEDLFEFKAAEEREKSRIAQEFSTTNPEGEFKPWRVFINHIDGYHGEKLAEVSYVK